MCVMYFEPYMKSNFVTECKAEENLQWCAGWRHSSPPFVVFRLEITALPSATKRDPQTVVVKCEVTALPDMAGFENKLGTYTLTQLNELLEDDEKLSKFIDDSEEVSFFLSWRASRSYRGESTCVWNGNVYTRFCIVGRVYLNTFMRFVLQFRRNLMWNSLNVNISARDLSFVCFWRRWLWLSVCDVIP